MILKPLMTSPDQMPLFSIPSFLNPKPIMIKILHRFTPLISLPLLNHPVPPGDAPHHIAAMALPLGDAPHHHISWDNGLQFCHCHQQGPWPGRVYREYHQEDYFGWLWLQIMENHYWRVARACIMGSKLRSTLPLNFFSLGFSRICVGVLCVEVL